MVCPDQSHSVCRPTSVGCSRRHFLEASAAVTTVTLGVLFPNRVFSEDENRSVRVVRLPRQKVGRLSELQIDQPVYFRYPDDSDLSVCMLVRTGERSGGGIGADQDVVAFSCRCTHLGGSLEQEYRSRHKVVGPCPLHLTTFDVTRHGMVVAGHATQALPQILLESDGDDVVAVGIAGLLYGRSRNDQFLSPV